jgi:exopolyphosphatase / guanosine-5'-triphosphate,3'-diphosphate pyrophosphatase
MNIASIDIGTNSTRLLIVQKQNGSLVPLYTEQVMTQLGMGLDEHSFLSYDAMNRVIQTLLIYKQRCEQWNVTDIHVMATSATRDARNRHEFLSKIHELGLNCRVLSGDQEANLSYFGATSDLSISTSILVCDIGGGSTEIITGTFNHIDSRKSADVGSSRLTRQFFHHDPVLENEIHACRAYIRQRLKIPRKRPSVAVFVGGSATTCAMMMHGISLENAHKVHHKRIIRPELDDLLFRLGNQTIKERKQAWLGLPPKRAEVILAGGLVLNVLLEEFGDPVSIVSLRDLLYGILL